MYFFLEISVELVIQMGIFSFIVQELVDAAPVLIDNVLKPGLNWINDRIQGMGMVNYSDIHSMDGEPDRILPEEERQHEEVLIVTQQQLTERQIFNFVKEQTKSQKFCFEMPAYGLKHSTVNINLQKSFTFGPQPTDLKLSNINYKDHVAIHIIPSLFKVYDRLLDHDLFKLRTVNIRSMTASGLDTSTFVGFLPETTNTKSMGNDLLIQLCKKLETEKTMDYNIRYFSPDIIEYNSDIDYKGTYKSTVPYIEPNKIMKTSYIRGLEDEEQLAYGTVVIIKQNVGSVIGMSFNVTLTFDVWDYTSQGKYIQSLVTEDYNNAEDDDSEGESGSGESGNGCTRKQKITRKK